MRIDVVPVGDPADEAVEAARAVLSSEIDASVVTRPPVPVPDSAYDDRSNQYNAERLIDTAVSAGEGDTNIALTPVDLFYKQRNYVFGLAYLEGNGCVVSTHRLRTSSDGGAPTGSDTIRDRVRKEVLHEVGHTVGLQHCDNDMCVMSFSPTVSEVDMKWERTCPTCSFDGGA